MKKSLLGIILTASLFSQHTFSVFFHEEKAAESYDKTFIISMCNCATREFSVSTLLAELSIVSLIGHYKHLSSRLDLLKTVYTECAPYAQDTVIQKQIAKIVDTQKIFIDL